MCNGTSTRTSQGGSIAVLRPTTPQLRSHTADVDMTLFFQNSFSAGGTSVELHGWASCTQHLNQHQNENEPGNEPGNESHWVVIHRDGDLTSPAHTPPLYSFSLATSPIRLAETLDLGVGERGVIGRRVSVMTSAVGGRRGMVVVAEGVMGWN